MARSQTAVKPAPSKPHRASSGAPKKAAVKKQTIVAPEFSPGDHHEEIAVAAYLTWLECGGCAEENWLKAEAEVRSRYQVR